MALQRFSSRTERLDTEFLAETLKGASKDEFDFPQDPERGVLPTKPRIRCSYEKSRSDECYG